MSHSVLNPHRDHNQDAQCIFSKTLTLLICFKVEDQAIQDHV